VSVEAHREELDGTLDAFELVRASRFEPQAAPRHEVLHSARDKDLIRRGLVGDAAAQGHRDAGDVIAALFDLADVDAGASGEAESPHRRQDLRHGADGAGWTVEDGEGAVASRL
jgi:hypothetical protein